MAFDVEEFRREFCKALEIAGGIHTALDVRARAIRRGGREYLCGRCPKCNERANLGGEGKHLCRRCGAWLRYRRES